MSDLAIVEVQKIGRGVVGFKRCEIFRAEVRVRLLAWQDGEEEREVRVIAVQQVQPAEVLSVIPGHCRKVSIQLVVGLSE